MNFIGKLLQGISFIPAIVTGIEGIFGAKSGNNKKDAALSFVNSALSVTEALASRDIVDQDKFTDGLSRIIDGTVQCLNASAWAKK